jgi:PAS domain S-box-containing protein
MAPELHYLKRELYELIQADRSIFEFPQEGSLDAIWYWDLEDPEVEWMSPRFWQVLGYDPAAMQHLSSEWQNLINPDDLKVALSNLQKHCADPNHPYDQVVRYRHKDGSTVWVRCRGVAIRDETGKAIRMLGAHTDLTHLKRTEEALEVRTVELEEANRELRAALDQVKTLRGLLPICASCKKIRDNQGCWWQIESYIKDHSEADFTHGLCPNCVKTLISE